MRTTHFLDVLNGVADLCGFDRTDIPTLCFHQIKQHISNRLKTAWEYHYWPELMVTERRYYRPVYDVTATYGSSEELYYPADGYYYQSLQGGNLGKLPGAAASLAWWVRMEDSYTADAVSMAAAYVRGDRAYDPVTDSVYQLIAATSTGIPVSDFTTWCKLEPFVRYIAFAQAGRQVIGDAFAAFDKDPRVHANASELALEVYSQGYIVSRGSGSVWLTYRIPCPILSGELWEDDRSYYLGEQVYFRDFGYPGNFYTSNIVTLVGESPATAALHWDLVTIPWIFHNYLQFAAYADWLLTGGQTDRALVEHKKADLLLAAQAHLYAGQQGQRQRTVVITR